MPAPELVRGTSCGVTLLGDPNRPGGVTLAFTERNGGVSTGGYASLNLGDNCGDDFALVEKNRAILLEALGLGDLAKGLVCPLQVHGDDVLVVGGTGCAPSEAQVLAREGVDAVVCTAKRVPVLLCFADCVPVILATHGAFAVIHSGWKGTMARIAAKALDALVREAQVDASEVYAYVGPHIGASDYEVPAERCALLTEEFGEGVVVSERNLDLGTAVVRTLVEAGIGKDSIAMVEESTASHTDRFYSYRKQNGICGRHGAIACMT